MPTAQSAKHREVQTRILVWVGAALVMGGLV